MTPFYIFNTLARRVEEFQPLSPPVVTFYSCGPTVYLPQHLGNMRAYVFVDTLRRALTLNGYDVRHVMNITDVGHMTSDADAGEDKIERTARAEGKTPREVADFYIAQFTRDCERLNIRLPAPPLLCRATDHVADMTALIKRIVERGYGYVTPSGVYFDVEKWRGQSRVGRLSRQSLDEQQTGQRLEHSPDKKSPHDFALWVLNQPHHLMQWESPWGRGYPGWHIECSAMSMRYLGETIDIHSGGLDHIPVHHENEIAQSEGATGKPFVRYFVHNAFLVGMEGAKISKSAGRFPVLDDLVSAGINPLAFRLLCLGAKYRSELAFSLDAVRAAASNLDYFAEFARNLSDGDAGTAEDAPWAQEFDGRFLEAVNNDLNTAQALAVAIELVGDAYRRGDKRIWSTLKKFDSVLGLGLDAMRQDTRVGLPPEIAALQSERDAARASKDFKRADELRKELEAKGYEVKDQRGGSTIMPRRGVA
ncbi:MAG TPA: cysteine--tRNA ligase [Candidatus Binataceae bacterium]|jgi:cysteinyl-tRNA synthetase|nr:cysteine--tRNA ligase [Candidatus Binataceae bacterium]